MDKLEGIQATREIHIAVLTAVVTAPFPPSRIDSALSGGNTVVSTAPPAVRGSSRQSRSGWSRASKSGRRTILQVLRQVDGGSPAVPVPDLRAIAALVEATSAARSGLTSPPAQRGLPQGGHGALSLGYAVGSRIGVPVVMVKILPRVASSQRAGRMC